MGREFRYDPRHPEEFPEKVVIEGKEYTKRKVLEESLQPGPITFAAPTKQNVFADNLKDPWSYTIGITYDTRLRVADLFKQIGTPELYRLKDLIDKILAQREDARK